MNKTMGIDVDSKKLVCSIVVDEDKSKATWKTFENREKDFCGIRGHLESHGVSRVLLEASGGYEQKIANYLSYKKISVHIVNPRRARNFAKGIGLNYKNDKIDAFALGRMAQVAKLPPVTRSSPKQLELKSLVVRRSQLKESIVAEKNRKRLAQGKAAKSIKRHIKFLEEEVEKLEKDAKKLIQSDKVVEAKKKVLVKHKGIGDVTATALLGLMPELGYISNNEASSLVGVAPWDNDSGGFKGKRTISGGRARVRKALYMPAWVAVARDPGIKTVYERHIKNGKEKKVAIVAIMRKLLIRANASLRCHIQKEENLSSYEKEKNEFF